jgi:hypothetical protein
MALDLYDLIDHGAQLLGWSTDTPAGQQRMAADLKLLAELEQLTAAEGSRAPGRENFTPISRKGPGSELTTPAPQCV